MIVWPTDRLINISKSGRPGGPFEFVRRSVACVKKISELGIQTDHLDYTGGPSGVLFNSIFR